MNSLLAHVKNYAPEDEGRTMIRKMIQEREAYLDPSRSLLESARNQKEIASKAVERLRHQLAEAERVEIVAIHSFEAAKKIVCGIEDTIAEHKAILHPIRCLPSDILCQIFECCTVDDDHVDKMQAAIRISSVCRTWHLVAHSLSSLWGHIDYSLWKPSVKHIFEHFLMRSPHHLNVRVAIDRKWGPMSSAPFSVTNFQFDRIRTLTIDISSDALDRQLWSTTLHDLTRVKIDSYPGGILRGDCLRHCKNLEELELAGVVISFNDDFDLPRLARISWWEYRRDHRTPLFLERLFKRAPHLKSFSFNGCDSEDTEDVVPYEHDFQPLGELTSLRIECDSSRHGMAPFLEDPSLLPSIQHLTLASIEISDLLDSVVQHSGMVSLTKLTLEPSMCAKFASGDGLVQRLMVFRHFQNLERLEVDAATPFSNWPDFNYSDYFIACLCEVLLECTSHPNFPSLRIIRFLHYAGPSVGNIIEMVKARMATARVSPEKMTPLDSVTFEDCEPLNVDEYRQLEAALGRNSS